MIQKAHDAFVRDLSQLLAERPGQWVAYHGDERIGFAKTKVQLCQECQRRGLDEEEVIVYCIEEEFGPMVLSGGQLLS
jgi:hypothetical protein